MCFQFFFQVLLDLLHCLVDLIVGKRFLLVLQQEIHRVGLLAFRQVFAFVHVEQRYFSQQLLLRFEGYLRIREKGICRSTSSARSLLTAGNLEISEKRTGCFSVSFISRSQFSSA